MILQHSERALNALREIRNEKLSEGDWTQVIADADVPDAIKNAYTRNAKH